MKLLGTGFDSTKGISEVSVQTQSRMFDGEYLTTSTTIRYEGMLYGDIRSIARNADASLIALEFKAATHTCRVCLLSDIDNTFVVIPDFNERLKKLLMQRVRLNVEYVAIKSISGRSIRGSIRIEKNSGQDQHYDFCVRYQDGKLLLV